MWQHVPEPLLDGVAVAVVVVEGVPVAVVPVELAVPGNVGLAMGGGNAYDICCAFEARGNYVGTTLVGGGVQGSIDLSCAWHGREFPKFDACFCRRHMCIVP